MRGFVLYEDKDRICIATLRSLNQKTGDMVQTWILPKKEHPAEAAVKGRDAVVCGDCKHRISKLGTCYVVVSKAPSTVWAAWKNGLYPSLRDLSAAGQKRLLRKLRGRKIRIGAYGDPAFVPFEAWTAIAANADGHTGYTHAWRTCDQRFRTMLMASVDSESEKREAEAMGWRTFRVRAPGDVLLRPSGTSPSSLKRGEMQCPASAEAGHRLQCEDCMACSGGDPTLRASVSILVHGQAKKRFLPMVAA